MNVEVVNASAAFEDFQSLIQMATMSQKLNVSHNNLPTTRCYCITAAE